MYLKTLQQREFSHINLKINIVFFFRNLINNLSLLNHIQNNLLLWSLITMAIVLFLSCWIIGKSIISCSEKCELNITSSCIQVRKSIINILSKINFMHNYWSLWWYMYIKEQCFNSYFKISMQITFCFKRVTFWLWYLVPIKT